jgi:tRNA(adenine34) deaminase
MMLATPGDEVAMRAALAEARAGGEAGEIPIGAVVVDPDGKVIASAHNQREMLSDPTAHAEVLALRAAARLRGTWRLDVCRCCRDVSSLAIGLRSME